MIEFLTAALGTAIGYGTSLIQSKARIKALEVSNTEGKAELEKTISNLQEELSQRTYKSYLLYEINKSINNNLEVEEISTLILQALVTMTGAESCTIMVYDNFEEKFKIESYCGIPDIDREIVLFNSYFDKTKAWDVMQTGEPFIEKDFSLHNKFRPSTDNYVVSVPIKFATKTLGVINIHSMGSEYQINDNHIEFLYNLAGQAALAMKNSMMFSELKLQALLLEKQAITDGLTGLYNHIHFQHKLTEELERSRRYNSFTSLILFDIDHFKHFNDTYGHLFGDLVLKNIAKLIEDSIRNVDVAARYGGEEFSVVLPHTDTEGAIVVAERIRKNIEDFVFTDPENNIEAKVTVSLGVAQWDKVETKSDLISHADQALYAAKNGGRNQVRVYNHPQLTFKD